MQDTNFLFINILNKKIMGFPLYLESHKSKNTTKKLTNQNFGTVFEPINYILIKYEIKQRLKLP
jgi:hypothetical protein